MRYVITGNFQYDLGLYGLKRLLDFFEEDYRSGDFYIEIEKKPEEILELVLLKLIADKGINHFVSKTLDILGKKDSVLNLELDLTPVVKQRKSLDEVIYFMSEVIFDELLQKLPKLKDFISRERLEEIVWNIGVELLNSVLHNFQANKRAKGKLAFDEAVRKLYKDMVEEYDCSFCGGKPARRISRDTFFFAPAQLNAFWFNQASIFVCPYCLASNLAVTQALSFLDNKTAFAVYVPNLKEMESLNEGLMVEDVEDFVQLTLKVISKFNLKYEAAIRELQIIEFYLDHQEPRMEFYILTEGVIRNLVKVYGFIRDIQEKYSHLHSHLLRGRVKYKKGYKTINLLEEALKRIFMNQSLFHFIQRSAMLSLVSENFRQKKEKNAPLKEFYPFGLLKILELHFKLSGGLEMIDFEAFKKYGQDLSRKIYGQLKERGKFDPNTYNNKKISLANAFLNASKGDLSQFMETLTRVTITYGIPISSRLLPMINENTYREISTLIALSIMSGLPSKNSSGEFKENENSTKHIAL